jgi:elongator complex protein 2
LAELTDQFKYGFVPKILCVFFSFPKTYLFIKPSQFVRSAVLSGHEDWVRSLAFQLPINGEEVLVLASGSQDNNIRLWNIERFTKKYTSSQVRMENNLNDELLDAFEASLGDLADAEEGGRQISLKRHVLTVKSDHER